MVLLTRGLSRLWKGSALLWSNPRLYWKEAPAPAFKAIRSRRFCAPPSMKALSYIAGTVALLSCGCVSSQRYPPHASWPAPVTTSNLGQFEGVFRNHSFDSQTGKAVENANELFVFLLGPAHAHENRGDRVEIRATANGNQLKIRLLDRQNDEIDAATLQRGIGFELSDGRLILHGPFTGLRDLNSNMGPG